MKTAYKLFLTILMVIGICFEASAQENIWSVNNDSPDSLAKDQAVARASFPREFKLFNLNIQPLRQQVLSIVDSKTHDSTVISLPNADGFIERFEIYEDSNFAPELQTRFPEIRAYSGRGITDPYATLKLSISPQGIQTMVFRTDKENEYIEPFSQDRTVYAVFNAHREKGASPWACSTEERNLISDLNSQILNADRPESSAGQVKTMRLAQSCNGEYANFFGAFNSSQVGLVLAAFNATITRVNGVNEKDLAVHLILIPQTTAVIYYDPATDPYTNLSSWNAQLQATLTANIGEANYDIGHMFGASGGGGNAGCIGCVCVNGQKGSGITSPADAIPQGDNFDIDYVVHEMGHQMGANHSFSFQNEGTGVQKEVGSGITIMGYAGITSQDVAPHSIDTFHEANIAQIQANLANKTCPVTTVMTVNHPPLVAPVGPYTIPISTAFTLTGSATDPEGDPLTYQWEQNDNSTTTGNASCASIAKATGPNWLSFLPTSSPTRTFPRLSTVLAGLFVTPTLPGGDAICNIEAVSSISRTLNFRLTVRDNNPYVPGVKIGQTQFADTVVNVSSTAGPFKVTAPNTNVTYAGGSSQTITWDVANTTAAPVSAANVKISISFDGGLTFPVVLADNTPNDGTETLTIPNTGTAAGRVKIEAVGNIFFDISDANFTVTGPTPTPTPSFTSTPTPTATSTNTGTPSPSPTNTATNTATATPTASPSPGCNTTVSYTGPAVAIPDNVPAGVDISIPVSGVGAVNDLNFRFDTAGACDATLGNVNAAMDHTFIGDLTFKLTPPDGSPTVSFQARRGGTRENICLTTLNDEGGFPNISTLTSVTGSTESGNFTPETTGMLSLLDGENANGTWVLNVSDNAGIDTGSMRRFSLLFNSEGGGCGTGSPTPTNTSTNTATPTATSTSTPGGTPPAVSVQFSSATYTEDESQTAVITINRTGDTTGTTAVNFATSNGTATGGASCTSGVDYISVAQAVTFAPNITSQTVNVQLCSDTLTEPTQTVNLTLTGASVGSPATAVLSIIDTASAYRSTGSICTTFGGPAAPYPATIAVSNGPASIGSIRVTLFDLTSTIPDSMDFLLVGPGGQKFILLADAGGVVDLTTPVTLTFSDAAGQVVPNNGPLTTGAFEPTSWEPGQTSFLAPAPPAPYNEPGSTVGGTATQTLVGNFGTTNSNGTWSLYMRDDAGALTNAITACVNGGWGLEFLGATAANASVSGRVTTADGFGIRNAKVVITGDSLAQPITATTGSFGYFTFDGLATGETYVVTVNSQRYTFAAPSRVLSLIDNVVDADFVADAQ